MNKDMIDQQAQAPRGISGDGGRRIGMGWWLGLLVAASVAFSLGFACAVPLAAFAALAGVTLSARQGVGLVGGVWLVNQAVGFTLLGYPWNGQALVWGLILGAVGLLALPAARMARHLPAGLAMVAAFVAAFAVYEGGLYGVSATIMGGAALYTVGVVGRIALLNAVACAALFALDRLVTRPSARLLARPRLLPPVGQPESPHP